MGKHKPASANMAEAVFLHGGDDDATVIGIAATAPTTIAAGGFSGGGGEEAVFTRGTFGRALRAVYPKARLGKGVDEALGKMVMQLMRTTIETAQRTGGGECNTLLLDCAVWSTLMVPQDMAWTPAEQSVVQAMTDGHRPVNTTAFLAALTGGSKIGPSKIGRHVVHLPADLLEQFRADIFEPHKLVTSKAYLMSLMSFLTARMVVRIKGTMLEHRTNVVTTDLLQKVQTNGALNTSLSRNQARATQ